MANFRVKAICKKKGMTLTELADKMNISLPALSQILHNSNNPSLSTMERMAEALEVDLTEIFEKTNPSGYILYKEKTYEINSRKDIENLLKIIDE